jgi:A nuclease family of the HNH/ENDO VII superfamily with conserved AHH
MEHAPQNQKPQQSQQYSYNSEVEQDTFQSQPSAHESRVDHSTQPDSLGVHPSQKKKEAIVPNPYETESPHKNLPIVPNPYETESPHKNLPPELKRSNPNPNVSELPNKLKESKKFTFEKPSEKDTDPNAPKLPNKLKESKRFTFEKPSEKDTPIALAPAIAIGIPDIQIAQNAATLNPGANAIAGKAFNIFLRDQLKKRVPTLAATMTGVATLDGPLPIGDALALGLSVDTLWQFYQEWVKLQTPKASSADLAQSDPQSNAAPAGLRDSTFNRPIDLGNVPQMGSTPDGTQAFLEAQKAQMAQQEQQLKAKWNREMQLAVSATHRRQQRDAVDDEIGDKLYKVEQKENLGLYQEWLLQNDPMWLDKMNRQSEGRYDTLSDSGKDFQFEGEESKRSFKQQLLSHTMYQSDIRARETIEYSAMELNLDNVTNQGTEFNPKKLAQIRTNFDAVAEGRYEKKLEPKVMRYVETQADAAYRKETNSKEANRNSILWKTLRNVELLKYDRTLWNTVQEAPVGMMTNPNDPALGSNALNRPGQSPILNLPDHTGHPAGERQQPQQPVGGGFDDTVNPKLTKPLEGFPTNQPVDGVTNVFDYSTWRRNYEKVYGAIPADNQVHHLATQESFRNSALAQQWTSRGLMNVHNAQNLIALPQNKAAYAKSGVKIQHSGSHPEWNAHATEVLSAKQKELEGKYGSLNKVPNDVMEQSKNDVMQQLREDLLDKDLGIEKGWIVPQPTGMDKVSRSEPPNQIG